MNRRCFAERINSGYKTPAPSQGGFSYVKSTHRGHLPPKLSEGPSLIPTQVDMNIMIMLKSNSLSCKDLYKKDKCRKSTGSRALTWISLAVISALCLTNPSVALAQKKRVVVLPFKGPRGSKAKAGFIRAIKRRVRMIPTAHYRQAAARIGVDDTSPQGIASICAKLRCDAVIVGSVRRKRRRYTVTVSVYSGNGETLGRRAAGVRGTRRIALAGKAIGKRCIRLIQKAESGGGAPPPPPPPTQPPPTQPPPTQPPPTAQPNQAGRSDLSDIPIFRSPNKRKKQRRGEADEEEAEGEEESEDRGSKKKGSLYGLLDISGAFGISMRNAELVDDSGEEQPGKYEGGIFSEFTIAAGLYPFVPFASGFLKDIGLGVSFSHHIKISTTKDDNLEEDIPTSSQEIMFDLRYRYRFDPTPTSIELMGLGGFGMRDFTLGENDILASFNYKFFRIGLLGHIPLGTPLLALDAGFEARPLLLAGDEAVYHYGKKEGGFGWSLQAGLSGRMAMGAFYFARFEYLSFSAKFAGLLVEYNNSEDEFNQNKVVLDRKNPSSFSDGFMRFTFGIGYAL